MSTAAIVAIVVGSVVAYALIGSVVCAVERRRDMRSTAADAISAGVVWPIWLVMCLAIATVPAFRLLGRFGEWVANTPDRRRAERNVVGLPKATAKERTK